MSYLDKLPRAGIVILSLFYCVHPALATPAPVPAGAEFVTFVSITKAATPATFTVGATGEYDIVVSNSSAATQAADAISVSDPLPAGVTLSSYSGSDWSCAGTPLVCTYAASVAAGASSSTLALTVNVAPGTVNASNTATVTADLDDQNCPSSITPTPKCSASVSVPVVQPILDISKTASPAAFTPGQNGSYVIVISNDGNGPAGPSEQIEDELPSGVTFSSYAGSNWSCGLEVKKARSAASRNGTTASSVRGFSPVLGCTYNQGIPPGGSTPPLTITVSVAADAQDADNSATVVSADPTCPEAAHCSDTVNVGITHAPPKVLPVDSAWALLLLATMLITVSIASLRKNNRNIF